MTAESARNRMRRCRVGRLALYKKNSEEFTCVLSSAVSFQECRPQ
jgi:hypothetical protein